MTCRATLGAAVLSVALAAALPATLDASNLADLQRFSDGYAELAAQVKPGVVAIVTESERREQQQDFRGTPFEYFFGPRSRPQTPRQGQGSGVIVEEDGEYFVLTNYHVIRGANRIRVELTDERHFEAEIVGTDSLSDLAALRIDVDDLPSVSWGSSKDLRVGEWVLAIGNPFALEHTVTSGIVSALGRARFGKEYGSFIQTDAAINPGNSGGALVNLRGELVGINTAIFSQSGGYQGIGFAIPVDLARGVLQQLSEHGKVRRGLLGIEIYNLKPLTAEALGMESTRGVVVAVVNPESGAAEAGLEDGDIIIAVDGEPVRNTTELRSRIGATLPGTKVRITYIRDGDSKTLGVTLGELTADVLAQGRSEVRSESGSLGLALHNLTSELAQQYGYEDVQGGVLVAGVRPGSEAARRQLSGGDLILEVNKQPVHDIGDYQEIVGDVESGSALLFLVRRGRSTRLVGLRMP